MDWAFDTGLFLWTSWGVAGLVIGVPIILVLFQIVISTLNGTKRFEAIFKEHENRFARQDKELARICSMLDEEKQSRQRAEMRSAEYRNLINSYTTIISTMLSALRMMQKTRKLTNAVELDKEIDILLMNVQTDLKTHNLMREGDNLITSITSRHQDRCLQRTDYGV